MFYKIHTLSFAVTRMINQKSVLVKMLNNNEKTGF